MWETFAQWHGGALTDEQIVAQHGHHILHQFQMEQQLQGGCSPPPLAEEDLLENATHAAGDAAPQALQNEEVETTDGVGNLCAQPEALRSPRALRPPGSPRRDGVGAAAGPVADPGVGLPPAQSSWESAPAHMLTMLSSMMGGDNVWSSRCPAGADDGAVGPSSDAVAPPREQAVCADTVEDAPTDAAGVRVGGRKFFTLMLPIPMRRRRTFKRLLAVSWTQWLEPWKIVMMIVMVIGVRLATLLLCSCSSCGLCAP